MKSFSKFTTLFSCIYFALAFKEIVAQNTVQRFAVFKDSLCENESKNLTESGEITLADNDSKIYLKINGMWSINDCKESECTDLNNFEIKVGNGEECSSRSIASDVNKIFVTRFGDAMQIEKEITFFDQIMFQGNSIILNEENRTLPSAITVRSYFFTGPNNWEIYNETNLEGDLHCIKHKLGTSEYGITAITTASLPFPVASVKLGCSDDVTDSPPTSSSETPATSSSETPATSSSEIPPTSSSETPATSSSEIPPTSSSETPATSSSEIPPTSSSETPATSSSETPATSSSEIPSTNSTIGLTSSTPTQTTPTVPTSTTQKDDGNSTSTSENPTTPNSSNYELPSKRVMMLLLAVSGFFRQ